MRKMKQVWTALALSAALAVTSVLSSVAPVTKAAAAEAMAGDEIKNPVYDKEKDETVWSYVYFGSYPQSEISGSALTEAITEAEYDMEGIATVDGVKYYRLQQGDATANKRALMGLTYTDEAFYPWENDRTYHYFRCEPIKWRVLQVEGDEYFLMSDYAIDCQRYSTNSEKYTWASSPMRVWLNGAGRADNGYINAGHGFVNIAFTEDEQNEIVKSKISTDDCLLWGGTEENPTVDGGIDTEDQVFLLSVTETMNEAYGFAPDAMTLSSTRRVEPTPYAFAMGTWLGTYNDYYGSCWWMLRTPGDYAQKMALIYRTGQVYKEGYYVNTPYYGVVPALRVKSDCSTIMNQSQYDAFMKELDEKLPVATDEPSDPTTPPSSIALGDVDNNGKVDLTDANLILRFALAIEEPKSDEIKTAADVNSDGKVDLDDANQALRFALAIIDKFEKADTAAKAGTADLAGMTQVKADGQSTGIWYAADSIAAQHNNETSLAASSLTLKVRDTLGWGVIFEKYFNNAKYLRYEEGEVIDTKFTADIADPTVVVNNTALSSRSSKSFTAENNYTAVTEGLKSGDYLFISFGHNDEYPQVERYTDPYGSSDTEGSYKWYLKTYYIDPALEKGATPILVSSVVKRNFINGEYQPQFHEAYATAMQELVDEYAQKGTKIAYIDLHHQMGELYKTLGDDQTKLLHASYDVAEFEDGGNEAFTALFDAAYAGRALTDLTNDEVNELITQLTEQGKVNVETSGNYMDNVHFTYAGAQFASKYVLEGMKDQGIALYELTNEEAVKTLDDIQMPEVFKENELYKNAQ